MTQLPTPLHSQIYDITFQVEPESKADALKKFFSGEILLCHEPEAAGIVYCSIDNFSPDMKIQFRNQYFERWFFVWLRRCQVCKKKDEDGHNKVWICGACGLFRFIPVTAAGKPLYCDEEETPFWKFHPEYSTLDLVQLP